MAVIAPSILSADFGALRNECRAVLKHTRHLHLDVMDGVFVSKMTFGPDVIKGLIFPKDNKSLIEEFPGLQSHCHLMVSDPSKWVDEFAPTKAVTSIIVHWEAFESKVEKCIDTLSLIKHRYKLKCGIAINPGTPVEEILLMTPIIDILLIMTVEPGAGGQSLIIDCLQKITQAKEHMIEHKLKYEIHVDGGINETNVNQVAFLGAEVLVAGSAVFSKYVDGKRVNPAEALHRLISELQKSQ